MNSNSPTVRVDRSLGLGVNLQVEGFSKASFFTRTGIGMQDAALHCFVDFAVGRREAFVHCLAGRFVGVCRIGVEGRKAVFDQRFNC